MKVIGRVDKADFPELSLVNIDIKIDTGAYTSSIHSHDIKELIINGEPYIAFQILDPSHPLFDGREFKTRRFKKKVVKNSFGVSEERYFIETTIILFEEEYPIHLSLSERGNMKYPILIGRRLLKKRFMVDPSKKNLSYKKKMKDEDNVTIK
jgi:hypothetical protein